MKDRYTARPDRSGTGKNSMLPFLCALACAGMLPCNPAGDLPGGSFLAMPTLDPDGRPALQVEPYLAHEGDLILFHEHVKIWDIVFRVVGSGPPDHSGVMFRLPDRRLAILEAAPENGKGGYILRVCLMEMNSRFESCKGTILIRRLRTPLTPLQAAQLTDFAIAQQGKRYSIGRLLRQFTPIRSHGSARKTIWAKTELNRRTWICSELVVAACTVIGLLEPARYPATAIYPLDLLEDSTYDVSPIWNTAGMWSARPLPRVDLNKYAVVLKKD